MADISMCKGTGCNQAEQCYRHRAIPNDIWQTWFMNPPKESADVCHSFWPLEGRRNLRPFQQPLPEDTNADRGT